MRLVSVLSSLWLAGCSVFGISDVKEPAYRVQARLGAIEIRLYEPRIVAETVVQGDELAARSIGFRRIAGYIFGANHTQAKIAMTAPVAVEAADGGQRISMLAPVTQTADGRGAWRIRFFMPAGFTLKTLPQPDNAAVHLAALPAQSYAVLRFSGLTSRGHVARETGLLLHSLAGTAWAAQGEPVAWFYDPPWTLPPLRRNEVAVAVAAK